MQVRNNRNMSSSQSKIGLPGSKCGKSGIFLTGLFCSVTVTESTEALEGTTLYPNSSSNSTHSPDDEDKGRFIVVWYIQLVYTVLFVSMVIVAAGGNIIVIWIVLAHKRMRTVTNYFLVNLAVTDALISLLNTLFNFIYMTNNHWRYGKGFCKFTQFIAPCNITASVFTFMAIAIDRYMAIIHPLKPRMTSGTVLGAIGLIWITAVLVALPHLLYADTYTFKIGRTVCYVNWPDGPTGRTSLVYNVFLMLVEYFVPLSILAGTYARVGLELWGRRTIGEHTFRQEETVRSKRRVVKMMIMVVVIFAVCWMPQHVYFIVVSIDHKIMDVPDIQHLYLCIYWMAMSNSMYNPLIYCWMNSRFRKGFKYVFRWLPCITWTPSDSLSRMGGTSVRMSVSEGTRFERNGSMMHTMIENMEESSYSTASCMRQASFEAVKEEEEERAL